MELVTVKKIDELGRVLIPKEAREAKGWDTGTAVAIYIDNDTIVLNTCPHNYNGTDNSP